MGQSAIFNYAVMLGGGVLMLYVLTGCASDKEAQSKSAEEIVQTPGGMQFPEQDMKTDTNTTKAVEAKF
jgi:hypothetical protein